MEQLLFFTQLKQPFKRAAVIVEGAVSGVGPERDLTKVFLTPLQPQFSEPLREVPCPSLAVQQTIAKHPERLPPKHSLPFPWVARRHLGEEVPLVSWGAEHFCALELAAE